MRTIRLVGMLISIAVLTGCKTLGERGDMVTQAVECDPGVENCVFAFKGPAHVEGGGIVSIGGIVSNCRDEETGKVHRCINASVAAVKGDRAEELLNTGLKVVGQVGAAYHLRRGAENAAEAYSAAAVTAAKINQETAQYVVDNSEAPQVITYNEGDRTFVNTDIDTNVGVEIDKKTLDWLKH